MAIFLNFCCQNSSNLVGSLLVSFVFSANEKAFVICTRVTEELHSFLSQSELSNFFAYIITDGTVKQLCL